MSHPSLVYLVEPGLTQVGLEWWHQVWVWVWVQCRYIMGLPVRTWPGSILVSVNALYY